MRIASRRCTRSIIYIKIENNNTGGTRGIRRKNGLVYIFDSLDNRPTMSPPLCIYTQRGILYRPNTLGYTRAARV